MGQKIPKGTTIFINTFAIHLDEKTWKNSRNFIPERFSEEERSKHERHPFSFIPFSAGPRNCIGSKFALQEATALLAMVMQKFNVITNVNDPVIMSMSGALTPKGLKVKYLPR